MLKFPFSNVARYYIYITSYISYMLFDFFFRVMFCPYGMSCSLLLAITLPRVVMTKRPGFGPQINPSRLGFSTVTFLMWTALPSIPTPIMLALGQVTEAWDCGTVSQAIVLGWWQATRYYWWSIVLISVYTSVYVIKHMIKLTTNFCLAMYLETRWNWSHLKSF